LAIVESYTLAAELSRCTDHSKAFASYEERLAPLLRSKQDAAVGLGLAFGPMGTLQPLVRNTVMRRMGLSKVADLGGQELPRRRRATDVRRCLSRPARSHGSTPIREAGARAAQAIL